MVAETEEAPGVEALGVEAPGVEAPGVEAPGVEAKGVEAPGVEAPDAEAAGVDSLGVPLGVVPGVAGVTITGARPGAEVALALVLAAARGSTRGVEVTKRASLIR